RTQATYRRLMSVRYLSGAYDVGADKPWRAKKDASVALAFRKTSVGATPPHATVYVVVDNLSTHLTPAIRTWAADVANNVALLPPPTYASWLNRIECHFRPSSNWSFTTATTPTGPPSTRPHSSSFDDETVTMRAHRQSRHVEDGGHVAFAQSHRAEPRRPRMVERSRVVPAASPLQRALPAASPATVSGSLTAAPPSTSAAVTRADEDAS